MANINELKARALEIQRELQEGRNTADRVGGLLCDMLDYDNNHFRDCESDIIDLQELYVNLTQSGVEIIKPTDTWPVANPTKNIIYRVTDRENTPPQYYSDYMYRSTDLTTPVLMATYDNAIDDVPTAGSNNLVKSGGVQNELALGAVYDVSAKNPTAGPNNDGKWESLSALLSDANLSTLIPTSVRKGGMSIKYVQSSDNNYVKFFCTAQNFTTDVTQWQGVDDELIPLSKNIITSDAVDKYLNGSYEIAGYTNVSTLINKSGDALVYYMAVKPNDGYIENMYIKVGTGTLKVYKLTVASVGGQITETVLLKTIQIAAEDGSVLRIPLGIQLEENQYIGFNGKYAFYFGQAQGWNLYKNNGTASNYAAAVFFGGRRTGGLINELKEDINELKEDVNELDIKVNGNIPIIDSITSGSITSSGIVVADTPSRTLYIARVVPGNIIVSDGDIYGYFDELPTIGSQTLDNTRHIETLNNTTITVPSTCLYIAIRSDIEPSLIYASSISSRLSELKENSIYDIKNVSSDIAMFENIGFCGDSYMAGMIVVSENPTVTATNVNLCWGKILERTHGVNSFIYAKGGVSVVDVQPHNPNYLDDADCLPKLLSENAKNLYVISLGHNDCYISAQSPTIYGKSWTKEEFLAEFNTNYRSIISQIATYAPNAKIILCKQSGPYARMGWGTEINNIISDIGEDLVLPVLDPNNDKYLSSTIYEQTMVHNHPVFAGYAGIAKAFDRQFCWATVEYWDYFKGYTGL